MGHVHRQSIGPWTEAHGSEICPGPNSRNQGSEEEDIAEHKQEGETGNKKWYLS